MKWHLLAAIIIAGTMLIAHNAKARDASFMSPGARFSGNATEVVTVEPQKEVSVGDTPINLGRRATFFFVNQTNRIVKIESIVANGDTNVKAEIVGDDCSSSKVIKPNSRCSVTIEATPTESGSWTAELLLTHNAQGRIARAKMVGKTSNAGVKAKDQGLSLSNKKVSPVDFGDVEVGTDKSVRSALMVNDSHTPITLLDIEVIASENGLIRADQGCTVDMELEVGESCPVTLIWQPTKRGIISTDLIIRHSGRMGFAVIPIRGKAKGDKIIVENSKINKDGMQKASYGSSNVPSLNMPRTDADAVLNEMSSNNIAVTDTQLTRRQEKPSSVDLNQYFLIGTVGSRGIIYKPDGKTAMVSEYDTIKVGDGMIEIISISPKEAVLEYMGEEKTLHLTSASALKNRAAKYNRMRKISEEESLNGDDSKSSPKRSSNNVVKLPVQK